MAADIAIGVRVALDDTGVLTDISDRVRRIVGNYGRKRGLYSYTAGVCSVECHSDDNWLTPGGGSTYQADEAHGGAAEVTATVAGITSVLFSGWIDDVLWRGDQTTATVTLNLTDGFARLSHAEVIADLPAELTGARVARLLDLVGYPDDTGDRHIDAGTILCEAQHVEGFALDLLRTCAVTEGGAVAVTHGGSRGGVLTFTQRTAIPPAAAHITDTPTLDADLTPATEPRTEQDPDLLVNRIDFTRAGGQVVVRSNPASIERYGVRTLQQPVFGSHSDTAALADWWVDLFAQSYFRVRQVAVAPHFETPAGAAAAAAVTVGDAVTLDYTPASASAPVTTISIVDGVSFTVTALDPSSAAAQVSLVWSLFPASSSTYWFIGDSNSGVLGSTTKLGPPISSTQVATPRNVPAGRVRWSSGDYVSAADFTGGVSAQVATSYDTDADRATAEHSPQAGQVAVVAPTLVVGTPALTLAVHTGRKFVDQLTLGAQVTVPPPPPVPVLTASHSGITGPLVLSWSYDQAADDSTNYQSVRILRKTYRPIAVSSSQTAPLDAADPLAPVTIAEYYAGDFGSLSWTPYAVGIANTGSVTLRAGWARSDQTPQRYQVQLVNNQAHVAPTVVTAFSEPVTVDPDGPANSSPTATLTAPNATLVDGVLTQSVSEPLTLDVGYDDADGHTLTAYFLWYVRDGAAFFYSRSAGDFISARTVNGVTTTDVPTTVSVTVPAGWLGSTDTRTYYAIVVDQTGGASVTAYVTVAAT